MSRSFGVALAVAAVALVASACTTAVPGMPLAAGGVINHDQGGDVDPSFINNTDGGEIDKLAATVIKDVEKYWRETFPTTFGGQAWQDLKGGYYSVDTSNQGAPAPPCVNQAADIEGNAFYCPTADSMAWDRVALLPVLKDHFGEAAVMLVLAHEMGHAVQRRAGITPSAERQNPQKYPTILLESQADCYAGTFVKWVTDGKADRLLVDREALDPALEAMVAFRDPVGTAKNAQGAHGDAFDRVSAFQDGFDKGSKFCSTMSVDNRQFTARAFGSDQDEATGGNSTMDEVLKDIPGDIGTFLKTKVGARYTPPKFTQVDSAPTCGKGDQGPAAFCVDAREIDVAPRGELAKLHQKIGDWATGTIVASRYGLSVLAAMNKPLTGPDAQKAALCVAGAYSGELLNRKSDQPTFTLSPGDLDEGVKVLLQNDYAARDADGNAPQTGFERVSEYRNGVVGGLKACALGG
ncbi:neutral zinc metallopeptidase [Actinocrispum wychmicini]|uniref:neutral zinc metallopeptidase n=1 Tax=Actinocrispum wychmicini TaxID=1213861 RepID=UPI001FB5CFB2|nr:neutral zinc metallopeptidase [Actinocrispum wychmicini]